MAATAINASGARAHAIGELAGDTFVGAREGVGDVSFAAADKLPVAASIIARKASRSVVDGVSTPGKPAGKTPISKDGSIEGVPFASRNAEMSTGSVDPAFSGAGVGVAGVNSLDRKIHSGTDDPGLRSSEKGILAGISLGQSPVETRTVVELYAV